MLNVRRALPTCPGTQQTGLRAQKLSEGFTLSQMIETFLRAIEASDFEGRLRELEEDQAARRADAEARRYNWAARFDSSSR